ncbi:ribonuclease III [Labilibaculum manganireducens]|uniref:Ribonuclease 3 n=1 Tax=Labilibaculum manganireducens TaxID=1940525 RepID=A0A2N3IA34_9BACT|nr:ribonuclease III [Labilibaculum manganireducens]PKQ67159.1 ribonuclease III [Labilibaculum manganireducens]
MVKSIFQSIKLFFYPEREFYGLFFDSLGVKPNNPDLYELAFIHKSATIQKKGYGLNNERLEYLGDAILGAIIADILYKYFPNKDEGFLTQIRSKIVSRQSLNKLAVKIELDKQVVSNVNLNNNKHIYGDAFEAFIGAIYLDQGYDKTRKFIEDKIFRTHINLEEVVTVETNFKSKLIEWAQKNKKDVYFDTHEGGIDDALNLPLFTSEVEVEEVKMGTGKGTSKKEAQQKAAQEALTRISQMELAF